VCPPIPDPGTLIANCGALQVHEGLPVEGTSQTDVEAGQLVYIARHDGEATERTIAIEFTAVPPNPGLGNAIPFSDARMFVELNVTTEDLGIRAFLDGEPWNSVQVISPDRRILQVSGVRKLDSLGLTELTFATQAPSLEELLAVFPQGEYEFRGRTVEGRQLFATATFTDAIPDGPVILTPEEGAVVDPDAALISWDPVTEPAGIEITAYRVVVERGDRGRTLSLELPPETTSVLVPPDFLEPGTDYLLQVFAIEVGGNQTITEGVFDTGEDPGAAEDIEVNDVCQKKIAPGSWHLCGTAPGSGTIAFENTGIHEAMVFTTPPGGIECTTDGLGDIACNIKNRGQPNPLPTNSAGQVAVDAGDVVYLARADGELFSSRTLEIQFTAVP
jgi:Fibronectin type III domain